MGKYCGRGAGRDVLGSLKASVEIAGLKRGAMLNTFGVDIHWALLLPLSVSLASSLKLESQQWAAHNYWTEKGSAIPICILAIAQRLL